MKFGKKHRNQAERSGKGLEKSDSFKGRILGSALAEQITKLIATVSHHKKSICTEL